MSGERVNYGRVKVLAPFSVSYHGIAYWADAAPEVPASVADHWLRNRWVTGDSVSV